VLLVPRTRLLREEDCRKCRWRANLPSCQSIMLTTGYDHRAYSNASHSMAYATSSPAATPGVSGNVPVSWHLLLTSLGGIRYRTVLNRQKTLIALHLNMATFADHERGNLQPVCQNCTTSTTPLWRRDEIGSVLCNACGLFLKLHGTPRPISLKTDVIKSRNRVKSAAQGQKKKVEVALTDI